LIKEKIIRSGLHCFRGQSKSA